MSKPKISVLGCGWLGLPLAQKFISEGFSVKGSTTTRQKLPTLQEVGIDAYEIRLGAEQIEGNITDMLQADILILNIPPGRKNLNVATEFPKKIKLLLSYIQKSPVKHLIFISSTSVYGKSKGEITTQSPINPSTDSGHGLYQSETLLKTSHLSISILRPGGLIGGNRHPGRFLSGRKNIKNGDAPVNLIHRDDVIGIIRAIIDQGHWGITINAAADKHPSKHSYYTFAAEKLGLEKPEFLAGGQDEKLISNQEVKEILGYQFIYTDPYQMI